MNQSFRPRRPLGRTIVASTRIGSCMIECWEQCDGARIIDRAGRQVGLASCSFDPAVPEAIERGSGLSLPGAIKGAVGLFKAETDVDAAPDELVAERQAICEGCERHFDFGRCKAGGCGCYLWAKIRIRGEQCPKEKW